MYNKKFQPFYVLHSNKLWFVKKCYKLCMSNSKSSQTIKIKVFRDKCLLWYEILKFIGKKNVIANMFFNAEFDHNKDAFRFWAYLIKVIPETCHAH